jgi:hypothetical protein
MADFERPGHNHSQQSSTKKHQGLSTSHCCYPNLSSNRASGNGVASWSQEFLSQHGHVEPVGTVPQPDLSRALLWPALYDSALEVPRDFEAMSEFQTWREMALTCHKCPHWLYYLMISHIQYIGANFSKILTDCSMTSTTKSSLKMRQALLQLSRCSAAVKWFSTKLLVL